jgi:hypothetical protein
MLCTPVRDELQKHMLCTPVRHALNALHTCPPCSDLHALHTWCCQVEGEKVTKRLEEVLGYFHLTASAIKASTASLTADDVIQSMWQTSIKPTQQQPVPGVGTDGQQKSQSWPPSPLTHSQARCVARRIARNGACPASHTALSHHALSQHYTTPSHH